MALLLTVFIVSLISPTLFLSSGIEFSENEYEVLRERIEDKYPFIDSVNVVQSGTSLFEYYRVNFDSDHLFDWFSGAKSIIGLLVGIAIDQGFIPSVETNLADYYNESTIMNWDPLKANITIRDLLMMRSGFEWGGFSNAPFNDLFASTNWTQFFLERNMSQAPGTGFDYDDGASHLLSAIITKASGMKTDEFATQYLFDPLDLEFEWDLSPEGVAAGFYKLHMSMSHMARIGTMILNNGTWDGQRIISQSFIEEAIYSYTAPEFPSDYTSWDWANRKEAFTHYGYQWWVIPDFFDIPIYTSFGAYGQYLSLLPDKNVVLTITADNVQFFFDDFVNDDILPILNDNYNFTLSTDTSTDTSTETRTTNTNSWIMVFVILIMTNNKLRHRRKT